MAYLVWIDLEMTGLDPQAHCILEIATAITDHHLAIVAEGPHRVIHCNEEELARADPWSLTQHQGSGLLGRVRASAVACKKAETDTLAFVSTFCGPREAPLCGNTVWQDRRFLIRHMPTLEAYFHYRNIDVSTIKELAKRWYPSLPVFPKKKHHLAREDILESISELRFYREKVFVP